MITAFSEQIPPRLKQIFHYTNPIRSFDLLPEGLKESIWKFMQRQHAWDPANYHNIFMMRYASSPL